MAYQFSLFQYSIISTSSSLLLARVPRGDLGGTIGILAVGMLLLLLLLLLFSLAVPDLFARPAIGL